MMLSSFYNRNSCFECLLADENKSYDICPIIDCMKPLFNTLFQSVPSLDVEVIMFFETTRLQDDLLDDGADCVIALPPKEHIPGSRQPSYRLWSSLLHLLNQHSHR